MKRKFTIFLIILTIILGVIGYFHYQKNLYSKEVLKLEILGPEQSDLAQEVEYIVKYKNNGNTRLEEPELTFEYPEHSLPLNEESLRVIKDKGKLGDAIYPGEEKTISFRARLFGRESEAVKARASLSYRPKNLKAYYESSTTFTTVIRKVPLTFKFDLPSRLESGKALQFGLIYYSNLDYPLSDLRVKVEYPSEFEFINSQPEGLEKNEWDVPQNQKFLNQAQGGRVEIKGKLTGKVGEQKVFEAKLGIWQEGEFVLLKETSWGVEIIKPSLYISQQINGNPEYIAEAGDFLHYEIFFRNIGEEDLTDLLLTATLKGESLDLMSLKSERGDFNPGDDTIMFDWRRNPDLQILPAKEEGKVEFWLNLKEDWAIEAKNPIIKNRIYLSQVWEEFETKVNSKLEISQKGYFEDEIFGNSGPLPPRVGEITTYTLNWQVQNYYNDVENVKVKATLPENVELTGKIFPEEDIENFSFDSESREIVWDIGEMEMGQGVLNAVPNISFQVSFHPNSSQKGETPEIISEANVTGEDKWTRQDLKAAASAIDTTLPDDEAITEEEGIIK
jgi:hypothetical protein